MPTGDVNDEVHQQEGIALKYRYHKIPKTYIKKYGI